MEKISVIIPVYNVKQYLERCVESVIAQTYKELEIILVDDGSTDGSADICDNYGKKDNRIVVVHKSNGGLSSARNAGMNIATGLFFAFLDSDDYLYEDNIEHQIDLIRKENADVVCTAYRDAVRTYYETKEIHTMTGREAAKRMFIRDGVDSNSPCKLYRASLFSDIRFPEGRLYENVPVTYKVLLKAETVVVSGKVGYYIESRDNSITRSPFKSRDIDYMLFTQTVLEDVKRNYKDLVEYAEVFFFESVISLMEKLHNNDYVPSEETEKVKCEFKKIYKSVLKSRYVSKTKKIITLLLKFHLYSSVWKIYHKVRNVKKRKYNNKA